jgi:hypothetical protein
VGGAAFQHGRDVTIGRLHEKADHFDSAGSQGTRHVACGPAHGLAEINHDRPVANPDAAVPAISRHLVLQSLADAAPKLL